MGEVTCTIPAYPSPELIFSTSSSDVDPQRQEQCLPGSDVLFGTTCTFDCRDGYNLTDSPTVTCLGSGDISNQLPNCEEIDFCKTFSPCPTVATCTSAFNSFSCDCNPGFNTQRTESGGTVTYSCVDIQECSPNASPCDVNAVCNNFPGSFVCTCFEGFQGNGSYCEAVNPCLSEPCQNGGTCNPSADDTSYSCTCPASYTGINCNTEIIPDGVVTFVASTSFNLNFTTALLNKLSQQYQETSTFLQTTLETAIQNGLPQQVSVVINKLEEGSVVADYQIYLYNGTASDGDQLAEIGSILTDYAQNSGGLVNPNSIGLVSTVTCPPKTFVTQYGNASFPSGDLGSRINATDGPVCPESKVNRGQPAIVAECEGDTISPCNWVMEDVDETCGRDLTADELLEILQQEKVTTDNAEVVATQAAEITENTESLTATGLETVADILQDIASVESVDTEVTELVVDVVSNMADTSDDELQMAQEMSGAVSRAVQSMEEQFVNVVIPEDEPLTVTEPNLAAVVDDVAPEESQDGFSVLLTVTGVDDTITTDDLRLEQGDTTETQIVPPEASIFIPSEVVASAGTTRFFATGFRDPSLFPFSFQNENNTEQNGTVINTDFNRIVNSRVISASVGNRVIENLDKPVKLSFVPLMENATNPICVFWDFDANNGMGNWSTRGCRLSNTSTDERPACECDHLTNFGILMDIYGGSAISDQVDFILEIISYVGCCMSIWGLLVTILTYAFNRKLRDRKPNQILISLSCALLGLYVTFVLMITLDTERGVEEVEPLPCCILAGFLHYFMLASLFWMGVEGYNMHVMFVRVLNTYLPYFIRKASLVAWGCPVLIVVITAGATRQTYAETDYCFLTLWPLVGGVLVPVGLIMIFNLVVFVRVIRRLNKTVKGRLIDDTEKRQRLRRFQNAICILLLMGLTWALGYLSIIRPASEAVLAVFTVLNSLQGYFIFMLYCVRQPQVRRIWRSQFQCCLPESMRASSFRFTSDNTSSTFKNSSGRLLPSGRKRKAKQSNNSSSQGFRPESVERTLPERVPRAPYQNEGFDS
ncbi:adhesion G-protein coupled receptor G7-like [Diadema antillarum]|uniref:adhesion G-protein coupled receptor G7-like n=1 Tax=Diadema antillarum TaxID=105358 RepID=UPI003A87DE04